MISTKVEGIIIKCPLNGLFHNARDIILTSQMAVSEVEILNHK